MTRAQGWVVTGSPGASEVEFYKFAELSGRMFASYQVALTVFRGSPSAASYRPRFEIAAIKAHAFLPSVFAFLALVVGIVMTAIVIGILQSLSHRRRTQG